VILGIDEAGRGALAGPLVVAGVVFKGEVRDDMFCDSKTLSFKKRNHIFDHYIEDRIPYWVSVILPKTIDRLNVLRATLVGMGRVISRCSAQVSEILIDGNHVPRSRTEIPLRAIIKGDSKVPEISCASIVAKVLRDRMMMRLHKRYPQYAFDQHFGYGTVCHYDAIERYGILDGSHRVSFNLFRQQLLFDV